MKTSFRNMYVVVSKKGNTDYTTLSTNRKQSIIYFLNGGTMTWKEAMKYGWRCIKVDVTISPVSNLNT